MFGGRRRHEIGALAMENARGCFNWSESKTAGSEPGAGDFLSVGCESLFSGTNRLGGIVFINIIVQARTQGVVVDKRDA